MMMMKTIKSTGIFKCNLKYAWLIGAFIICHSARSQTLVTDVGDLKDIVQSASPGDTITIQDGTYEENSISLQDVKGTEESPIRIQAQSIGGVTFSGETKFVLRTCEHVIIEGIVFTTNDGTAIKLEGSNNIRITRNTFRLEETESTKWVFIGGVWDQPNSSFSHHNRIDHNLFEGKTQTGHYITIDGSGEVTQSQFDVIDHNYFKDNTPRATNEKESIRIGWSEMSESSGFTTVEFNLFEECNGDPEIVSVKSCDNTIRHNTFLRSEGTLSLRHGNRNHVEGNYFLGGGAECSTSDNGTHCSGGVRIYGEDHVVINNYFEGLKGQRWDAPITLTEGDAESGNSNLTKHFRIERAIIANNTLVNNDYGIEIGYDNNGSYSKPARDVVLAYNLITGSQNDLIYYYNEPDNMTWVQNVIQPTGTASLTSDERSFSAEEVSTENTNLTYDEELGMWVSTSETPTVTQDETILDALDIDIHGQEREETSTIGADNFSMESVRYAPLTATDVGPSSYHPDYDIGESERDYLLLSANEITTSAAPATLTLDINTNLDWIIEFDETWATVDVSEGSESATVNISIEENTDFTIRSATLTIQGEEDGLSREVVITQEAAILDLGGEQLTVASISASAEQDGNEKENAIDGDPETRWSAEGEQFLLLELDDIYVVSYAKISFLKGDSRTTTYQLEVSLDNESFTTVVAKTQSSGTTEDLETIDFEDVDAKYVKLTGYGNSESGSDWNSITEIEIWGSESDIVEPTEPVLNSITDNHLIIFPNPASDYVNIQRVPSGYTSFAILSLAGRTLKTGILDHELAIDLTKLQTRQFLILKLVGMDQEPLSFSIIKE